MDIHKMQLMAIEKVFADGNHNAFTGLGIINGLYVLAFRKAPGHVSSSSAIVFMESMDAMHWSEQRRISLPENDGLSFDLRDSYFISEPERLLYYGFATPVKDGRRLPPDTILMVTSDGRTWTNPSVILTGAVLWHPVYAYGRYYSAGYYHDGEKYRCELFCSPDGINWEKIASIAEGSETAVWPAADGSLAAFLRTEEPPYHLEIYRSKAPFTDWIKTQTIPKIIQCPHIFTVNEQIFLAGRERPDYNKTANPKNPSFASHRTKVWEIDDAKLTEVIELPSRGDNAYTGTVVKPEGSVLMSYYSQHESAFGAKWHEKMPADIFVAHLNMGQINA